MLGDGDTKQARAAFMRRPFAAVEERRLEGAFDKDHAVEPLALSLVHVHEDASARVALGGNELLLLEDALATYDGPTWLDEAIVGGFKVHKEMPGFPAELRRALAERGRWLARQGLAAADGR